MHHRLIRHGCGVFIVVNALTIDTGSCQKCSGIHTRINVYLNYERETDQSEMSPMATLENVITVSLNSSSSHFSHLLSIIFFTYNVVITVCTYVDRTRVQTVMTTFYYVCCRLFLYKPLILFQV